MKNERTTDPARRAHHGGGKPVLPAGVPGDCLWAAGDRGLPGIFPAGEQLGFAGSGDREQRAGDAVPGPAEDLHPAHPVDVGSVRGGFGGAGGGAGAAAEVKKIIRRLPAKFAGADCL